jgi:hypothetical protein
MKIQTKQVCIWSAFWKHGWILLKLGKEVCIEKGMIENKSRVKKIQKSPQKLGLHSGNMDGFF